MSGLRIEQEGKPAQELDFQQLAALDSQIDDIGSLIPGRVGGAVPLQAILDRLQPDRDLDYLTVESTDGGFAASVPLEALRQAIIAYRLGDQPLPRDKGGPLRFLIPNDEGCATGGADACANVKFVGTLRLTKGQGKDTRPSTPRKHAGLHESGSKERHD
jgi:DMSO/TMAO reductase YedYZ molybdopterin-dependent catalytic subunit